MTSVFMKRYNALPQITYNPLWGNGTGYFDFAVNGKHAPKLKPGQQVSSMTDNNRRMIITGTSLGNVVVFQRYPDRDDLLVYNASREFNSIGLIPNKRLDAVIAEMIIGNEDNFDKSFNVSTILESIVSMSKKPFWNTDTARPARDIVTVQLGEPEDTKYVPNATVLLIGEAEYNGKMWTYGLVNNDHRTAVVQLNKNSDDTYNCVYMFHINADCKENMVKGITYFHLGVDVAGLELMISLNLHKVKDLPKVEWLSGN